MCVCVCSVPQTLCNPMDCSPPGFSVHGIFQARILEWVAISSSKGSSQPRDQSCISRTGRQILYHKHHLDSGLKIPGRTPPDRHYQMTTASIQQSSICHHYLEWRAVPVPLPGSEGVEAGMPRAKDKCGCLAISAWSTAVTECLVLARQKSQFSSSHPG